MRYTTVKATCPVCGDVDLDPDEVTAYVWNWKAHAYLNRYEFTCPTCHDTIRKHLPHDVYELLKSAGCTITRVPFEMTDPIRETGTRDDLLDALSELAGGDVRCPQV